MRRYRGRACALSSVAPLLFTGISAPATVMRLTTSHAWYARSCGILPPFCAICQASCFTTAHAGFSVVFPPLNSLRLLACRLPALIRRRHRLSAIRLKNVVRLSTLPEWRRDCGLLIFYLYLIYTL